MYLDKFYGHLGTGRAAAVDFYIYTELFSGLCCISDNGMARNNAYSYIMNIYWTY